VFVADYGGLGSWFWEQRPLVGMIHVKPLPGSPRGGSLDAAVQAAVEDTTSLQQGGADGVIVENFFDSPFPKDCSPPHTVAALAIVVREVRRQVTLPVGVNVLRNDALSALGIAFVCGARFVRVNVFVGAAVTDQGIIEGAARQAVLYRKELGADIAIWADVHVKHASSLGMSSIADDARDAAHRGGADALVISGAATGQPTRATDLAQVRQAVPHARLIVGSGFGPDCAGELLAYADGAIVGTGLKRDGRVEGPVDVDRVRALRAAVLQSMSAARD
jgi:membrane complex biogenesis BtpA family protein